MIALTQKILAFVVTLGLLVVFHELGHYVVARLAGVKVLRFSVGFGRIIWSRRFGPDRTEWAISAVPLGGYVKMADEREGDVASADLPRAFNRQSVWRRIAIVAAGPIANLLLAVLLFAGTYIAGVPGQRALLAPPPAGTPAASAGFMVGDLVTAVDDDSVHSWQDLRWRLLKASGDSEVAVAVERPDGARVVRRLSLATLAPGDWEGNFLASLGLSETGLTRVVRAGYQLLDLVTFFTVGPKEARAWTVRREARAPEAAGVIHTDFEKGFIRAETIAYDDYVSLKGEAGARDAGRLRLEGKEYAVKDGDVFHFRFNV